MNLARWSVARGEPELVARLAETLNVPLVFARCLANRGCAGEEQARAYLEPRLAALSDPFLLPNMDRAVARLWEAREAGEPLIVFGDYDVDGVTATALLTGFLREFGWQAGSYLPHRIEEGYGLTRDGVRRCLEQSPRRLILAVDCGSTAVEVIAELQQQGVDVIVLDHHQVSATPPPAVALVNPQLLPGESGLKHLCSAGLAFKLAHAVVKRGRALGWPKALEYDLRPMLDLVALGTIADMVPLRGENRALVRAGLQRLDLFQRPGLRALAELAGVKRPVGTFEVAFQLAPRLNAAGRLETALHALELILATEAEPAGVLARALDSQNQARKSIEQQMVAQVVAAVRARFDPATDFAIVEGREEWHIGVVGIVASRVVREFHRPAIILGGDGSGGWRGSGRSVEGFDLAGGLNRCAEFLHRHGGHAMAAGVTMVPENVPGLRARLNELVRGTLAPEELCPTLHLDAEVTLAEINPESMRLFPKIEPVGLGNPPAQLAALGLRVRGEPRRMGTENQHLRFTVTDGQTAQGAVWWNCGADRELPPEFDAAFVPEWNEYGGTRAIQLRVLDLRSCSP